jgi:DNA-binding NtrC family response regulator
MTHYDWPGNIRELRNALERAYCMAEDNMITSAQLPSSLWLNSKIKESSATKDLKDIMEELEKEVLLGSLNRNHGNVVKASKELGIHKSTFYKKIQNWDLDKE